MLLPPGFILIYCSSNNLDGRVVIAEFPEGQTDKNCLIISTGAYDWYNEPVDDGTEQTNGYLENIKQLTTNSLKYLSK